MVFDAPKTAVNGHCVLETFGKGGGSILVLAGGTHLSKSLFVF